MSEVKNTFSNEDQDKQWMHNDVVDYSVVIPIFNEEESLKPLFAEILKVMAQLNKPYEIVFVNDCSNDQSLPILEEFVSQLPEITKIIDLKERSGQTKALFTGMNAARGKIVISLDGDMQNDPNDIPALLEKMEEGYSCVCGWRKNRQDTFLKAILSKSANIIQRGMSGLKIHDISCTLRAYKRECIKDVDLEWEGQHRFIPLSLSLKGYTIGEIISNHRKRQYGSTKYTHKRVFRVVSDFFKILKSRKKSS